MKSTIIEHPGTIIDVQNNTLFVKITSLSACSKCHAVKSCSLSESVDKIIEIPQEGRAFKVGQSVNVLLDSSIGNKAIFLSYLLPFFVLLISLIIVYALLHNELLAGLISLGSVVIYYIVLQKFNHHIKKLVTFKIEAI